MGAVYRARDQATGEVVALKFLRGGPGAGSAEARFVEEARVLAALSHPGIVRYVAHGRTADGEPYLVMEWLKGEDLAARLRSAPLSVEEAFVGDHPLALLAKILLEDVPRVRELAPEVPPGLQVLIERMMA